VRHLLIVVGAFLAGYFSSELYHSHSPDPDLTPVEVYSSTGVNATLVAYRATADGENYDLSTCPSEPRPLWRITFRDGHVGYFLTETTP